MAIFVRLHKDKFGVDKVRGKWYAKIVRTGDVDIEMLAERVQRNSTFKRGEVRGIIVELLDEIKSALQDGHTVDLEGLGRFHLTIESNHVDSQEDFRTDRDIREVKCKFRPAGRRRADGTVQQLLSDGVQVLRWRED